MKSCENCGRDISKKKKIFCNKDCFTSWQKRLYRSLRQGKVAITFSDDAPPLVQLELF